MRPTGYQRNRFAAGVHAAQHWQAARARTNAIDSSRPSRAREGDGIRSIARWKGWSIVA
jgi:hypothetical protein